MSNRKVTLEETAQVHNSIEQCLTRYMTKKETKRDLFTEQNIEPCFTDIIWKRMAEQNQAFFKEYYKRLVLKEQIVEFNRLLREQEILIRRQGLQMPTRGSLEENTGPVLMPGNAQIVADWYNNCGSYSHGKNTNPCLPSSSCMECNSQYLTGALNMIHEGKHIERNISDFNNGDLPQDMSNLYDLNYITERQSQDTTGSVRC